MSLDSPLASPHRIILGFHIASGQAQGPRTPCATTVRRAKSSLCLASCQPRAHAAAASYADSPLLSSETDDDFSDEEEAGSPQGSLPILIRWAPRL
jgi:hypothetical protein